MLLTVCEDDRPKRQLVAEVGCGRRMLTDSTHLVENLDRAAGIDGAVDVENEIACTEIAFRQGTAAARGRRSPASALVFRLTSTTCAGASSQGTDGIGRVAAQCDVPELRLHDVPGQ